MMTTQPLWRAYVLFLMPMMLSNVLQSLFGTVNGIYLGQMIGVDALAAVSIFFPVMFFFLSFILGLGAGSSMLIGQAWGAREAGKAKAIAGTTLALTLLGGGVIAVGGGLFARELMMALAVPSNILDDATDYARIMMITMPAIFTFLLATAMMRGVGDTVTPLWALAISTAIGLVVTPALIRGWFGLPRLGVVSAAIASAISAVVTLLWLGLHMRWMNHPLAPDKVLLRAMRLDRELLGKVLRIGIPTAVQLMAMSLAEIVLLGIVNGFGSDATAAYGAVNQVLGYAQFPAISIAITASIFAAQAIGAGESERIGAVVRTAMWLNLLMTGGLVVLGYLFSRTIVGLFITSPEVLELAQTLLYIVLWSTVPFGMACVFAATMRASGTVMVPTLLSILAIVVVEVPVAIVLSRQIGVEGVWIAYPAAFCAMMALQMAFYLMVWRKQEIRRLI
ncbi:Multi antimicrobial extrusion protein MatE [Nitrobacter winogradskyi Nb-255]|uniref:Multi antimicrobial extrusion protein MatE n=1 Tax=Nitrobacter winogradskyi (strain ATCC 25391 / DSM 10237 / CIP 104748 / NCIMB 11846 / Nb-255) TaxID=323098 RepID=Q3SWB1_NITWN|nr:MATE family efflux transporter [Nitrobacter winogradskyi]ABA03430.1 Multi antimicrobial extrusion protein MatE [Nitrobacter winogradskyi Nb-255]